MVLPISSNNASSTSPASPTRPILASTSLLRWLGSSVEWMMVLPFGMAMPNDVSVKEQPMPKITSASPRNFGTARGTARPPEPSDSGGVSGQEGLPPGRVGAGRGGGVAGGRPPPPPPQPLQLRPGLGVMHALAGIDHRALGVDQEVRSL